MTTTQPRDDDTTGRSVFYAPATAVASDRPGRIERFLTELYRLHRFRGGVTARSE